VKSVLGEFSSDVSICRNQGTQSELGAFFCPPPPARRERGPFPRLWLYSITFQRFAMTTQQKYPQNPAFYLCMVLCLNLNTKNSVSALRMETGGCCITKIQDYN